MQKTILPAKYKQYRLTTTYRGIRIETITVASSRVKAAKVLGVSAHYLKEHCSGMKPTFKECIENPEVKMILFERSGEGGYFLHKKLFTTLLTEAQVAKIIDDHRKLCPNYDATLKKYGYES